MTQAHSELKSLKLNKKPLNTPLGVRVSKSYHSSIQFRERILTSTLEISTISVPRHKESDGKLWSLRNPLRLLSFLHQLELIQEHLDQRHVALFSRSMFFMVSILFFNTYLAIVIDLESL